MRIGTKSKEAKAELMLNLGAAQVALIRLNRDIEVASRELEDSVYLTQREWQERGLGDDPGYPVVKERTGTLAAVLATANPSNSWEQPEAVDGDAVRAQLEAWESFGPGGKEASWQKRFDYIRGVIGVDERITVVMD